MTLVKVEGLQVRYGDYEVLHDISFEVRRGDFVAVVGPNGSGKTTLVKALVGLIEPAAGSISFRPVEDEPGGPARTPRIGYLPQKSTYSDPKFPASVREVVASGLRAGNRLRSRLSREEERKIDETLELLMIADLADRRIGRLSGGQQQRAHLARALVASPDMLVLDEPTGALDPATRACFYETMRTINEDRGASIVFVTHDLEAAAGYAGTLLFVDRRLVYSGSMEGFDSAEAIHCYFGGVHRHAPGKPCAGGPDGDDCADCDDAKGAAP